MRTLFVTIVFMLLLGLPAPGLRAGESKATSMASYLYLKQDSDLFVGEGTSRLSEFSKDLDKARQAAKERSLADLASSVRVRVSSETSEHLELKQGKSSEAMSSDSSSRADVALENVKFLELDDFPSADQVTVLASISKEDYRRQLAGKSSPVYRPETGVRVFYGGFYPSWATDEASGSGFNSGPVSTSTYGAEVFWRSWVLGLGYTDTEFGFNGWTEAQGGSASQAWSGQVAITSLRAQFGYDWTPWAWRVQPYVPLRLEVGEVTQTVTNVYEGPAAATRVLVGPVIGLGLRYWPFDAVAFDVSIRSHPPIAWANFPPMSGAEQGASQYQGSLDNWEWQASVVWSGF
jgi:hypothetical protein